METTDSGPQVAWADTCEDASENVSSRMNFSYAVKSGLRMIVIVLLHVVL